MRIHVARNGDSLWQIAQNYGSAVNQIVLLNELDNPDVLVVGQTLVIPEPGLEHVIQPGDTLWQIAQMLEVTVQELTAANNITDPSLIYAGQMLKNPYFTHIVRAGEYIWLIAQQYGASPEQIIAANDIEPPGLIFPGQTLRIPATAKPVTEVNAYTTRVDEQGVPDVLRVGRYLTYLSPFMYSITEDGSLTILSEEPVLQAAKANNVAPLLVVTNFTQSEFNSDLAAAVLRNTEAQEQLISELLEVMRAKGYAGVNFNFEYVYPEDRENYNQFLRRVVARLHPEGFLVSTALAPKETAGQEGLLYEAHDYQAHGEIADFVALMTYEWGWAGGEPWAIAPVNKVRDILDYAVTVMPRDKILMGVPLYGRDWEIPWTEGTIASTVSPKEAVQLAAVNGVAIQYDETYQSPFFRYTDETGQEHEVWFEDARSMQAKYDAVKEYGLRGVSYWALGTPFPQNWPVLQDNFNIRKY
ncbi:LysM peptidoglycan-binding domain-containing protein [Lentibacillus amyloliquefaciens]|uniref:Spore gernimation protein n=1 Tax=Lentibacillus amyloliquefaciens TaxID=1472767 RepID=A0A0U3W831_9BACI|nr:LysM peptidoglycan-binding domain-containing protein [Lentibacillus amyloliquefaciens]ALX49296.1 spore gernimation protein [Lentibacillus amyloliquefaciens]